MYFRCRWFLLWLHLNHQNSYLGTGMKTKLNLVKHLIGHLPEKNATQPQGGVAPTAQRLCGLRSGRRARRRVRDASLRDLCRLIVWCAEHIGAQVEARHGTISRMFNCSAIFSRNSIFRLSKPLPDMRLIDSPPYITLFLVIFGQHSGSFNLPTDQ